MIEYDEFLARKRLVAPAAGFEPTLEMNSHLYPFQRKVVEWAIRRGRAGMFMDCGLGKSLMSLEWARHVAAREGRPVLILTPLAVAKQFGREGDKFGIPCTVCRSQADVRAGVNVTNYQMLRHFTPGAFAGVVCDESDILASFGGATKKAILAAFRDTPYKLDCSATPAPNDHMEIGNHADFLGVMEPSEMLSRWFINDGGEAGKYRLKGHAREDFWRWVASWATAVTRPSDLGYDDGAFDLPPLDIVGHVVEVDHSEGREPGMMFRMPTLSATGLHAEKRLTAEARAARAAAVVAGKPGVPWVVWCDTDYEADALRAAIPDAEEIRGSESIEAKEAKLARFIDGDLRILITKPRVAGHGLNLQFCRDTVYVGLSYSFKYFYQSIRRFWRFGQTGAVTAHVIEAETEGRIGETVARKQADHEAMGREMVAAMASFGLGAEARSPVGSYDPGVAMILPSWLNGGVTC